MGPRRTIVFMVVAAVLAAIGGSAGTAGAAVEGRDVQYSSAGATLKGYLAWDAAAGGKRPGVLVVHEWWGHTEYARRRARMLAELGYVAFALDMYGDGKGP